MRWRRARDSKASELRLARPLKPHMHWRWARNWRVLLAASYPVMHQCAGLLRSMLLVPVALALLMLHQCPSHCLVRAMHDRPPPLLLPHAPTIRVVAVRMHPTWRHDGQLAHGGEWTVGVGKAQPCGPRRRPRSCCCLLALLPFLLPLLLFLLPLLLFLLPLLLFLLPLLLFLLPLLPFHSLLLCCSLQLVLPIVQYLFLSHPVIEWMWAGGLNMPNCLARKPGGC